MSNRIRRHHQTFAALGLTASLTTTPEIDTTEVAGGCVLVPSGSPLTTLTYYGARQPGATYGAIQDGSGNAVTSSVSAGNGYPIPDACFGYGSLKIVANAAGTVDLSFKG